MSQNVFLALIAGCWLVLYIHWPEECSQEMLHFYPECYRLCLVIFSPTLSSPMLHFSIIPHWPQMGLAVFFFSALLVCCTFLSSLISCVEGGIWCLFWPMWCFGLELKELLQMRKSQTLFFEFTPTASVHCWTLFFLHFSCCISFIPTYFFPHHLSPHVCPLLALCLSYYPSISPAICTLSSTAPVQLNPCRWPHFYDITCLWGLAWHHMNSVASYWFTLWRMLFTSCLFFILRHLSCVH